MGEGMEVFIILLALMAKSSVTRAGVVVRADTTVEVNGVSAVAKVFGLSAYQGSSDFKDATGAAVLRQFNVDAVGLGQTLGTILPQHSNTSLNVSALQEWLGSPAARELYENSRQHQVLQGRQLWKGGAQPFLFLKNPDGMCSPEVELRECMTHGTPVSLNTSAPFEWWAELFVGYFHFCKAADPGITTAHLWNEPNAHFWMDGKNGTYYAQFFVEVATALKSKWPSLRLGGPVTWDPPDGPFLFQSNHFVNWVTYAKPLMDLAAPKGLIDFVDFHAYDANANPASLRSAVQVAQVYPGVQFGQPLPIAITESNYKLNSQDHRVHFLNRTFPLLLSTLALMRHPDRVVSRLVYDYKSNDNCTCGFVSGTPENLTLTPTAQLYGLLGKLSNGTRVSVEVDIAPEPCVCYSTHGLGHSQLLAESALVDTLVGTNLTLAIINTCNCTLTTSLQVKGVGAITDAWAAILNVHSLHEVPPPSLDGKVKLTPLSLLLATFALKGCHTAKQEQCYHSNVLREVTVLPTSAEWVMKRIPVNIPCNFSLSISFNITPVMAAETTSAQLRVSILGDPGQQTWQVEGQCTSGPFKVAVAAPGVFTEIPLPCVPTSTDEGLAPLQLSAVSCTTGQTKREQEQEIAYFSSALLVLKSLSLAELLSN